MSIPIQQARLIHQPKPMYPRLAIAARIVQQHGGRIAVDSSPGRGTRFTIALPIAADAPGEEQHSHVATHSGR